MQPLSSHARRSETLAIEVAATPTVYRRAIGNIPSTQEVLLSYLMPATLLLPGLIFGSVGTANVIRSIDAVGERADRLQTTGVEFAILGGALLIGGAILGQWFRPSSERGSSLVYGLGGPVSR